MDGGGDIVSILREKYRLETQNVIKANNLCNGELTIPDDKDAISQRRVFELQLSQFIIPKDEVAILSAFPLFNFNYFKHISNSSYL